RPATPRTASKAAGCPADRGSVYTWPRAWGKTTTKAQRHKDPQSILVALGLCGFLFRKSGEVGCRSLEHTGGGGAKRIGGPKWRDASTSAYAALAASAREGI